MDRGSQAFRSVLEIAIVAGWSIHRSNSNPYGTKKICDQNF
jgi:hypothetical protein